MWVNHKHNICSYALRPWTVFRWHQVAILWTKQWNDGHDGVSNQSRNPMGVELFSYVKNDSCSDKFQSCWSCECKTLCIQIKARSWQAHRTPNSTKLENPWRFLSYAWYASSSTSSVLDEYETKIIRLKSVGLSILAVRRLRRQAAMIIKILFKTKRLIKLVKGGKPESSYS